MTDTAKAPHCKHERCLVSGGEGFSFAVRCSDCGRRHLCQFQVGPRGGWAENPKWVDRALDADAKAMVRPHHGRGGSLLMFTLQDRTIFKDGLPFVALSRAPWEPHPGGATNAFAFPPHELDELARRIVRLLNGQEVPV